MFGRKSWHLTRLWFYFFQILFLSGLALVIGLERTFKFFFQWQKAKGSTAFFGGIVVVLLGYPIIGMIVEIYGFVVLFRCPDEFKQSSFFYALIIHYRGLHSTEVAYLLLAHQPRV